MCKIGVMRRATHAGSWYNGDKVSLERELESHLSAASVVTDKFVRAVIVPHAGYRFCARSGAYSFKHLSFDGVKRVFVFGPSHHTGLRTPALTSEGVNTYETPLGNLSIDRQTVSELMQTNSFQHFSLRDDETEHSLEMQFPFLMKIMNDAGCDVPIVPVVFGHLSRDDERRYGEIFSKYVDDSENLFVLSSDFCHWGPRFGYTLYNKDWGAIHESIRKLDDLGMDSIASLRPKQFTKYLSQYGNTICGRVGITVFLNAVEQCQRSECFQMEKVHYSQSNEATSPYDSSVSYASMVMFE